MNQKVPNMNQKVPNNEAGKGDTPRNCFSHRFKENYDNIKWLENKDKSLIKKELKKQNASSIYIYK